MVHRVPCVSRRPSLRRRHGLSLRPRFARQLGLGWQLGLARRLGLGGRPPALLRLGGVAALVLCTACILPPKPQPESVSYSESSPADRPLAAGALPPTSVDDSPDSTRFQQAAWPVPPSNPPPGARTQTPAGDRSAGFTPPPGPPGGAAPYRGWPEGNVGVSAGPPANNPLLQPDDSDIYDPSVTVATVGNQYILRGDLLGEANIILAPNVEKIPPEQLETQRAEILAARDQMARQLMNQAIERKLMYIEFLRSIPEAKRKEAEANIQQRVGSAFDTELQEMVEKVRKADPDDYPELARNDVNLFRLAMLMNQQQLVTTIQLDNYLRRYGSSLDKQRQAFAERALGRQALVGGIETQPEVTHIEMLDYYNKRIEQFQVPDRAKWEQLTARFDRFNTREECRAAINAMGNEVWLGGARLDAVAKRSSHEARAKNGGFHDWTEWGDLEVSREIQQAVFTFPPGKLSPVIEDVDGFHIIRVIERSAAHITPFTEAQAAIKEKLRGEKRGAEISEFVAKLRKQTPIWTIYDEAPATEERVADPSPRPGASYPR